MGEVVETGPLDREEFKKRLRELQKIGSAREWNRALVLLFSRHPPREVLSQGQRKGERYERFTRELARTLELHNANCRHGSCRLAVTTVANIVDRIAKGEPEQVPAPKVKRRTVTVGMLADLLASWPRHAEIVVLYTTDDGEQQWELEHGEAYAARDGTLILDCTGNPDTRAEYVSGRSDIWRPRRP